MVTLLAKIDFFSPLWASDDLDRVICKGTTKEMATWMLDNCPCSHMPEDFSENTDDLVSFDGDYIITYRNTGMIEELRLYKK